MFSDPSRVRGGTTVRTEGCDKQENIRAPSITRGGYGPAHRGRGGLEGGPTVDHTVEKAAGKNAAIEETKALLAKMRLEDKEIMNKYKKERGDDSAPEVMAHIEPGAYRPRDRPGREERGRERGRGRGLGRGRGGLLLHRMPGMFPISIPGMPGLPGDFRTPPFPGLDGFLPQGPVYFPPGFPHGILPGSFPAAVLRARGFPRGFPAGFPPRGFSPALPASRSRGRGNYPGGVQGWRGRGGHRGRGQLLMTSTGEQEVSNKTLTELQPNFEDTPPVAESDNAGNVELEDEVKEGELLNGVTLIKKEEDTVK